MNILLNSNLLAAQDWYVGLLIVMVVLAVLFTVVALVAVKPKKKDKTAVEDIPEEVEKEPVKEETSKEEVHEEPEAAVDEEEIPTVKQILGDSAEGGEEESAPTIEKMLEKAEKLPVKEDESTISIEQILNAAEEETDEEPEYEILPEEDEPQEEVRSVNKVTGMAIIVRYKKSFTAKYIQSDDMAKAYYAMLKNELLSYNKVKSRVSWSHENFNSGRNNIARFSIRGKSLCIYFALNPADYEGTKYRVEAAESKKYEGIPCMYRIKNARRAKYALDLIADLAAKFGLEKGVQQSENYYLSYEPVQPLVERGLIKELVSEEDYNEFMRQFSRKEVDRKRRKTVSAQEVNEVITDEVANALVEDKRSENVKSTGKKGIVNVDTLSNNYEANETVTLESLKKKGLIDKNVAVVKVLARGTLTKPLTVEAQDFSIEAVKMIVLTGGKATKV